MDHVLSEVWRNSGPQVVRVLLKHGADPNLSLEDGQTPLVVAMARGNYATAAALVEGGADPTRRCRGGDTPLHYATRRGDLALVRLLLGCDAVDVNARGVECDATPLFLACASGDVDVAGEAWVARRAGGRASSTRTIRLRHPLAVPVPSWVGASAPAWIVHVHGSRRRRGCRGAIPRTRRPSNAVAAAPRPPT